MFQWRMEGEEVMEVMDRETPEGGDAEVLERRRH